MSDVQSLEYSKFPAIHHALESIPYPGSSWVDVLTSYPSIYHLHWVLLFALLSAMIRLFTYALTKLFAPILIGYTPTPPLPQHITKLDHDKSSYYIKIGEAVNYRDQQVDIQIYDLENLSAKYSDSKLSTQEISEYLAMCNKHHSEIVKNEKRFQESLFPTICKLFTFGFGVYAVYDKEWLYDGRLLFYGWPYNQGLDCCIADVKLIYLANIGFVVYKSFGQVFLDRHLKDFYVAMVHHFITIILLSLTYTNGLVRSGIVVLLLHDPADIILNLSKFFRVIQQQILMNIAFTFLVLGWFTTRIVVFPLYIVWPALKTCLFENDKLGASTTPIYWGIMLCSILYCLHLHWFCIIIQAVIRTVNGNASDPRSDNEYDTGKEETLTEKEDG